MELYLHALLERGRYKYILSGENIYSNCGVDVFLLSHAFSFGNNQVFCYCILNLLDSTVHSICGLPAAMGNNV
jgi:hypothetical protein